ncbi:MAG: phosphate ABC transporter permease PstA [Nitrososphaerales archaeon]
MWSKTNYKIRKFKDRLIISLTVLCVILAIIPLTSILIEVVVRGLPAISIEFLTSPPGVIGQAGGGIANAIQGTLILIGLSSLIGVPLGVLAGVYLAEFGDNPFGRVIRFFNDVLMQMPSIVIGIFVYILVVLALGRFSSLAGAVALSIIMLPIVVKTTEESIRLVPNLIREAALGLGLRRWRVTLSIVVVAAKSGVITGIMLAVARIAGETAPLIMTVLGNQWFVSSLFEPIDAIPLRIWRLALLPYDYAHQQGWGAALVLITIVLVLNVAVKALTRTKFSGRVRV